MFDNHYELTSIINTTECDIKTSDCFKRFLLHCITEKKTYTINKRVFTLKSVLANFISSINETNVINYDDNFYYGNIYGEGLNHTHVTALKESFLKNFFFNLLSQFYEYLNLPFDSFAIGYWFNRMALDSLYYDEVGIGGTINNVSTLYMINIDEKDIIDNTNEESEIIHRVIKLFSVFVSPLMRIYLKYYDKVNIINI